MKIHCVLAASCLVRTALSFQVAPPSRQPSWVLASSAEDSTEPTIGEKVENLVQDDVGEGLIMASSAAEGSTAELVQDDGGEGLIMASAAVEDSTTKEKVGNLVQDDEWEGLGMELSELVRTAVLQDLKTNAREFLGKEDYKLGDISKEIDSRVKNEVARMRGKEEYELGDFVMAMDEMSKGFTEELTGKPYEIGDLSKEIDIRVKSTVAEYCGKDEYEFGDLSREIDTRVKDRVAGFTSKEDYEFGDISIEIESRRREWVKDFLGEDAAKEYVFGDVSKKAIANFTGKDDYQFGDITKKLANNLFGPRKGKYGKKDE